MDDSIRIRPAEPADRDWIIEILTSSWGAPMIGTRGRMHDASRLPAWIAMVNGRRTGLLTYRIAGQECEIVSLNSLIETRGVGSALLEASEKTAREAGCTRICVVTSNDNLPALRFYQRRGYRLSAVYPGAIDRMRRIKPEIPEIGLEGIPLRDEIELARDLTAIPRSGP